MFHRIAIEQAEQPEKVVLDRLTKDQAEFELPLQKKAQQRQNPNLACSETEAGQFRVYDPAGRYLHTVSIKEQYAFGRALKST